VPIYNLTITYYTASQPTVPNIIKLARPFTQWFDATGRFVPLPFQQMFASEVPVIGKADSRKAVAKPDGKAIKTMPGEGLLDDIISAGNSGGVETNSTATPRKGGSVKNRKKA
jgi:signal peptidase complex subunit 2